MLMLNLPSGVESGDLMINGRKAEAKIDKTAGTLAFRYLPGPGEEPGPWDVRLVEQAVLNGDLVMYACSDTASPVPSPESHPTHEELCRIVEQYDQQLQSAWGNRSDDDTILVLGDLRHASNRAQCEQQYGVELVESAIAVATANGARPFMTFLQPLAFIDALRQSGSFSLREAAKELAGFASIASITGIVPLLVILPSGSWATQWSRPDSGTSVVRYKPETPPESN